MTGYSLKLKVLWNRILGRQIIHFLHIGKTGGSVLKHALKDASLNSRCYLLFHGHSVKLEDIPRGEKIIFGVRDPVARFVSAFYSRKRQGRPRYHTPWNDDEKKAFFLFKTPNELANALSSSDFNLKDAAMRAMCGIAQIRNFYWFWFRNEQYFLTRISDVFYTYQQEFLNNDFEALKEVLGLPEDVALSTDEKIKHANPTGIDRRLDEMAINNLQTWFSMDYEFIALLKEKKMIRA